MKFLRVDFQIEHSTAVLDCLMQRVQNYVFFLCEISFRSGSTLVSLLSLYSLMICRMQQLPIPMMLNFTNFLQTLMFIGLLNKRMKTGGYAWIRRNNLVSSYGHCTLIACEVITAATRWLLQSLSLMGYLSQRTISPIMTWSPRHFWHENTTAWSFIQSFLGWILDILDIVLFYLREWVKTYTSMVYLSTYSVKRFIQRRIPFRSGPER